MRAGAGDRAGGEDRPCEPVLWAPGLRSAKTTEETDRNPQNDLPEGQEVGACCSGGPQGCSPPCTVD